jgi:hypothetical protein
MTPGITTCDTGLGTTYARWALNRVLSDLQSRYEIKSVLEGPSDGMPGIAGINSLVLAQGGAQVTVVLPDQPRVELAQRIYATHGCQDHVTFHISPILKLFTPHPPFDLVWNFNVMPRLLTPGVILKEMVQASGRLVLIFVPNRANYASWLHMLRHRVAREEWADGQPALLAAKPWKRMLQDQNLSVHEIIPVGAPWRLGSVGLGQRLRDMLPFLSRRARTEAERHYQWEADNLPYFDPERYPEVHRRLERMALIERSHSRWLKTRFAHHVGILAEKRDS